MKAELIFHYRAELGEGMNLFPDGLMRWVDLPSGSSFIWDGTKNHTWHKFPFEISKILPWKNGAAVLGQPGVLLIDSQGNEVERIQLNEPGSNLRCSDGVVLPNGELLLGILDADLTPHLGRLVHIRHDRSVKTIVDRTSISNGVTLLADGVHIAWADSPKKIIEVFEFDYDRSELSPPKHHADLPDGNGLIDGMCADSEGGIWAALWKGSGVAHFDSTGKCVEVINFESPNVTSCAFDASDDLILTTGTATLSEVEISRYQGAGGLWRIRRSDHGVRGAKVHIATL